MAGIAHTGPGGVAVSAFGYGYDAGGSIIHEESVPPIHIFFTDRLTAMLYPGGSREQYRYDAVGNPVGYRTRAGQVRTSVFDNRNREIQTNWSDSTPDITRTFDAAGRILSEENGAVSLTYSYNAANQVLSETTQVTGQPTRTVGYAYDAAGRLASTIYPGGNVVAQSYTPLFSPTLWSH